MNWRRWRFWRSDCERDEHERQIGTVRCADGRSLLFHERQQPIVARCALCRAWIQPVRYGDGMRVWRAVPEAEATMIALAR